MRYKKIVKGKFISRPNRFIAYVEVEGTEVIAHVKNTGRCKELLLSDVTVYLEEHDDPKRKTKYSLIAVEKGDLLINMDSQAPNKVVGQWLEEKQPFGKQRLLKAECKHGDSRFDFYLEVENNNIASAADQESTVKKLFIEVKGVTLEMEGLAMFPDAPTERGLKHVRELTALAGVGYGAAIIFVIQMEGMHSFTPNSSTQPEFAAALKEAQAAGVKLLALECSVEPDSLAVNGRMIPIQLDL